MRKNKKAVAQAVAWVLLVGLSVSLAIFVGLWLKSQSKESLSTIAEDFDIDTRCADTILRASPNCDPDLNITLSVNLQNKGSFTIIQVKCNDYLAGLSAPLTPEQRLDSEGGVPGQDLYNCFHPADDVVRAILTPYINKSGQGIPCPKKKVEVTC